MAYKSTSVLTDITGEANYQQWNIQQVSPVLSNTTVSKIFILNSCINCNFNFRMLKKSFHRFVIELKKIAACYHKKQLI